MKYIPLLLLLSTQAQALEVSVGIGFCDGAGDYCPQTPAFVEFTHTWFHVKQLSISSEATHISNFGDGEPRSGDYGANFIFPLKATYKFF